MSITASDLKTRYSTKSGTAGNQLTGTAGGSLGKYVSTTDWNGSVLNDLFPDVSGDDNLAGIIDYRCVFIINLHATLTWTSAVVWIDSQVSGGTAIEIGVDPTPKSNINSIPSQAVSIPDGNSAPIGVSFSAPTTKPTGLSIGDLAPNECRAVWIKRIASNQAALTGDGMTLKFAGDSL